MKCKQHRPRFGLGLLIPYSDDDIKYIIVPNEIWQHCSVSKYSLFNIVSSVNMMASRCKVDESPKRQVVTLKTQGMTIFAIEKEVNSSKS